METTSAPHPAERIDSVFLASSVSWNVLGHWGPVPTAAGGNRTCKQVHRLFAQPPSYGVRMKSSQPNSVKKRRPALTRRPADICINKCGRDWFLSCLPSRWTMGWCLVIWALVCHAGVRVRFTDGASTTWRRNRWYPGDSYPGDIPRT